MKSTRKKMKMDQFMKNLSHLNNLIVVVISQQWNERSSKYSYPKNQTESEIMLESIKKQIFIDQMTLSVI